MTLREIKSKVALYKEQQQVYKYYTEHRFVGTSPGGAAPSTIGSDEIK